MSLSCWSRAPAKDGQRNAFLRVVTVYTFRKKKPHTTSIYVLLVKNKNKTECSNRIKLIYESIYSKTSIFLSLSLSHSLSLKPLVSLHICVPVVVAHQLLLVLLHQAVETVTVPALRLFLRCFCLLKNNKFESVWVELRYSVWGGTCTASGDQCPVTLIRSNFIVTAYSSFFSFDGTLSSQSSFGTFCPIVSQHFLLHHKTTKTRAHTGMYNNENCVSSFSHYRIKKKKGTANSQKNLFCCQ